MRNNSGPKTVEHKIEFIVVMENEGREVDENLTTTQKKTIEFAAGNVAHCTKAESVKFYKEHQTM